MVSRKPIPWFISDQGKKFTFAVISGTGLGVAFARFAPNTFFLQKYKNFVQYYRNGQPADLPKELQDRCQECLDLLNITPVHRRLITPFSVFGYDLFHAGNSNSKYGVLVGIPVNFTYKSLADIEKDDIQVNQKRVDWTTEVGKKLADALILPEKVQQFAICREILMTHNYKLLFDTAYPFLCLLFVYNASQILNKRLNLYARPVLLRAIMYSLLGMFGLGTYFLLKDMTEVHYESEVDRKLCELGPEYIESGVIFYDKLLKRNQALRELMGSEGERKYSKLGNENFGLRQPRIALVHRKLFFEHKLEENASENVEEKKNIEDKQT